ncbi:MAG: alpha/beta hydrolase [Nocardioides sp.]|nr:alpha/beta hydrolase [Nocardioides sp.]
MRALGLEDPTWMDGSPWGDGDELAGQRVQECQGAAADLDAEVAAGRRELPGWPEAELRAWAQASAAFDLEFGATGHAWLQEPWREIAAAIGVPTLVVTGTERVLLGPAILDAVAALGNPHLEVVVVAGAGHCVRRDRTEDFHALVDPWIERVVTAG